MKFKVAPMGSSDEYFIFIKKGIFSPWKHMRLQTSPHDSYLVETRGRPDSFVSADVALKLIYKTFADETDNIKIDFQFTNKTTKRFKDLRIPAFGKNNEVALIDKMYDPEMFQYPVEDEIKKVDL